MPHKKLEGRCSRPSFHSNSLLNASFSSLPFSWLPLFLFSLPFFMEKSATNVLLQLIDCIESLKNEVKRKMHAMKRAMLYQSHTLINSQEKNIARRLG
jgi:hypothetical protein